MPGCTPSTSYYYGESCQRLGAIASEFGISDYNPQYAHASASDETEDDEMEMVQINLKYDFNIFDANLILTEKDFTANAYTDWARIDMDDLYIAPLVVENDTSEESFTELRITSKPGTIEWTIGYYNYEYEDTEFDEILAEIRKELQLLSSKHEAQKRGKKGISLCI